MGKIKVVISLWMLLFLLQLFCPNASYSKFPYRPGDWTSYTVLRYVSSIDKDFNYIYFGTTGGVSRYDFFANHFIEPLTESDGLLDDRVQKIAYDPMSNEIWFRTSSGVCRYNPAFQEFYYGGAFPDNLVHKDSADFVFPAFFMDYGYSFIPDGYITDIYLDHYSITDRLFDMWGNLWIGTWGLNAGVASLRALELKMLKAGLYNDDVKALLLDGDDIWFGGATLVSRTTGLTRYNPKDEKWDYFESTTLSDLVNKSITCMEKDSQYVWFGTTNGLLRYDKKKDKWRSYDSFRGLWDNQVTALKSDPGLLWIGTRFGLNLYYPKGDSIIRIKDDPIRGAYIYSIEKDTSFVWLGTDRGAFQINKRSGELIRFAIPEGVLNQWVKSVFKYQDELWFGTTEAVVEVNLKTRDRKIYQSPANYPGSEVNKIVCDDKYLWVGTILGVWKLNKIKNTWKGFFKEDGLLDNYIQDLLLDGDYVWFGTQRGATRLYWKSPLVID